MRILIDGDACPVVSSIVELTAETGIFVYIFRSYAHYSHQHYPSHVQLNYIDGGRDAVDFAIIKAMQTDDLIVTQDYGLASIALQKSKYVMHHSGYLYTNENIEQLLTQRFYSQQERRKSRKHPKGPKPFTDAQRHHFEVALQRIIKPD
ncbi:YaiI/YqxD family protein [Staphylococcus hyicus]|uniref:YaiI/YqxD family protein n=1 Tax=Staphylococcus hyicus TaxID=1284 RepID=UPI00208E468B|nr:YaiI/YqxD family protein [Staphylococcus hyicus]MCO4331581.1 YaiI/YqxD family protein [Staphylococcus hyicus]MCO4334790.1 YaiI/YqxD family protein [Staphylococcus hyicus]